jgi:uncharacterized protein YcbK (DUF882 family)
MDFETINVVQEACEHFAEQLGIEKVVLNINSAARCLNHNESVGSTKRSMHPRSRAMDFTINDVSNQEIYDYLDRQYPDKYGIGLYSGFVHFDTRADKARW